MAAVSFAAVWTMACNVLLNYWRTDASFQQLVERHDVQRVFLLSSVVLGALLAVLTALTNRLLASCGVLLALCLIVAAADHAKLELRREPVYPSDVAFLREPGFLTEMVSPQYVAVGLLGAAGVVVGAALLGRLLRRWFPHPDRTQRRLWLGWHASRVVVGAVALSFLVSLHGFNHAGSFARGAYEKAGVHWKPWAQSANYKQNGFVAGFLYNMPVPAMREPKGYSAATMREIAARYAAPTASESAGGSTVTPNVVVVLSEAFSDPTRLHRVHLERDPIPYTRALMGRTTSGNMLAQLLGGGTANMEFETLTGQSLSQFLPQMNTPYQMLVDKMKSYPSAVGYAKQQGHPTVGVHPFIPTMYRRDAVYPVLGFDRFVSKDKMVHRRRIEPTSRFISDGAAFDEVLDQLRDADGPALVNLVTMQNHYPMKGQYPDPMPVTGITGTRKDQLANYARGLEYSDRAMKNFLASLRQLDEPTTVVFFGDHLPSFWAGSKAMAEEGLTLRQTPYFLWSNGKRLPARHEDLTSPIYFLPLLWQELGLPLPPYYRLLLELHEQIPAMEQGEYYLPDGRRVTESGLPPEAKRLLRDYRLVQYDFSIGHRYAVDQMFPQTH
ncbi:LTA synthase family protein [Nocardioides marmoribigeumensis]|uniref:Phosphoglycerol transferase MdoB-like AlkP superfamily enzyme n=1 Tax=Nocardioides marmoribigeumensis TaxID=433649 RepID=A0ABU2BPJ9_9ACTN|nr:LTA synthase family protein [Nocardioides marmoribigeumensis]MDR7360557.1 phosphoglycerol transferase MdoB-like AlkP superfamily enzyme [Nocardioides marmoribigeumensis]